jgi:hypothetical protein
VGAGRAGDHGDLPHAHAPEAVPEDELARTEPPSGDALDRAHPVERGDAVDLVLEGHDDRAPPPVRTHASGEDDDAPGSPRAEARLGGSER